MVHLQKASDRGRILAVVEPEVLLVALDLMHELLYGRLLARDAIDALVCDAIGVDESDAVNGMRGQRASLRGKRSRKLTSAERSRVREGRGGWRGSR